MKKTLQPISIIVLLVSLLLSLQLLSAQDDELISFESANGEFTFDYPAGWFAAGEVDRGGGGFFAMAASSESALPDGRLDEIQMGDRGVVFIAFTADGVNGVPPGEASPESLVQFVVDTLENDPNTTESFLTTPPTRVTLANGHSAGRVDINSGAGAGVVVAYAANNLIVSNIFVSHVDDLAAFEPLAFQIINSLELDAEALASAGEIPPLADLLDPDAPVLDVIVDVDAAHEDMHAVLFLLNHPNVNVRAVTVAGTGEAHCEPGVRNMRGLLVLSGHGDIPVACGRETPLLGDHEFPAEWRERADSAYGVALPTVEGGSEQTATELITSVIEASVDPITVIAVGPLTNLAEVLQNSPELAGQLEAIYVMGGAVNVPGNVGPSGVGIDNAVAEWNMYIDPRAANVVLQSGAPVTLVLLDATDDVPVTMSFYQRLEKYYVTPEATFVYDMLTANLDSISLGGFQFWDSLTAAIATDESLAKYETKIILVEEAEGPEHGYTRLTGEGVPVQVAIFAYQQEFEDLFLAVLNHAD